MMKEDIGHVKEIYETSFHDISYSCHQFSLVTPSQSWRVLDSALNMRTPVTDSPPD